MCDPLTIAGAALTIGSTVANNNAMRKAEAARNDALAAERIRQRGLDREAEALAARSQDRYQNIEGQREDKSAALGDYFVQPTEAGEANESAAAALPSNANGIVVREMNQQKGKAKAFTDQQGRALGDLRAFGDVLGDIGILQGQDASLIGQIGGFKRGSSNILPLELDVASRAGDRQRVLGDLLGGFGSIGLTAGLTGGSLGNMFGGSKPLTAVGRMGPVARAGTTAAAPTLYPQQFTGIY